MKKNILLYGTTNYGSKLSTSDTLKEWQSKQFEYMKQFFNPIQEQSKGNDIIDEKTSINNKDEIESLKKQILEIKKELKKKI